MSKIRRMFPGANTAQGFYSFHSNIMGKDRNSLYILKGMPGGGKSSLMEEIGNRALKEGLSLEYHHCPSDPKSIDGLVIDEIKIGIVDGTPPHSMDTEFPGISDRLINLSTYISHSKIDRYRKEISEAKFNNRKAYRKAFNYFRAAKYIYDEIIEINGENVNFEKINTMSRDYINEIFSSKINNMGKKGFKNRHMFSNAYTPKGLFDYTDTIVNKVGGKYYLDGEMGTGKSTFLGRIKEIANIHNYHLEIYHNPLLPHKIESILIKELDLIISSNEKIRSGKFKTINFNQYYSGIKRPDDFKILDELINNGVKALNMAVKNHLIQEKIYNSCIDFKGIDREREKIWEDMKRYI